MRVEIAATDAALQVAICWWCETAFGRNEGGVALPPEEEGEDPRAVHVRCADQIERRAAIAAAVEALRPALKTYEEWVEAYSRECDAEGDATNGTTWARDDAGVALADLVAPLIEAIDKELLT